MEGWLNRFCQGGSGISRLALWSLELTRPCRKVPWLLERGFVDTRGPEKCLVAFGKSEHIYELFETISGGYIVYDHYFLYEWLWRQSWHCNQAASQPASMGQLRPEGSRPYLGQGGEMLKNEPSDATFVHLCSQRPNMLKISLLVLFLWISGARG